MGMGVDVTVGVAAGALVGVWVGVVAAAKVGEAEGTGKDGVEDGCRAEGRPHAIIVVARIAMHNKCVILKAYLLSAVRVLLPN
jgi:hypothetical protein